ncbi:Major Facilitator Superfamily domain containing protein [Naviculisporaceae sp. PSN 640]
MSSKSSHGHQPPSPDSKPQTHQPNPIKPNQQGENPKSPKEKVPFGPRPSVFPSTPREILFILIATIATATASFLQGASSIITSSIGSSLNMTQAQITWITASTALTAGAFQLGLGQLADLTGRKTMFIAGLGSFSAFSLLVAFSKNAYWMDIVSGILGISSAMVVPPAIGIMGAAYDKPSKRKNLAFSAFSAGNPLGFVFGSILSGLITRPFERGGRDGWRAAYVMVAVLWAGFTVLAIWGVPTEGTKESFGVRMRSFLKVFDSTGTILTIFGTGMLTAGITLGPSDGWGSPQVIALLTAGAVFLVIFVFWERVYPTPLMPPHIWKDRNFTFIILSCLPGYMAFISTQFWLSFFMQEQQHLSPLIVALHLLPQAIAGLIYNVICGSILHRINNTLLLVIGSVCYVASNVLLSVMPNPEASYWAYIFPALILSVVGADFHFNVANMYVMQSLPSHQQALAGGIFSTIFRLGSAVALGISTAVFTSVKGSADAGTTAEIPTGQDPMLPYTRAFQVSIALAAASFLFLPFVRVGTQGGSRDQGKSNEPSDEDSSSSRGAEDGISGSSPAQNRGSRDSIRGVFETRGILVPNGKEVTTRIMDGEKEM